MASLYKTILLRVNEPGDHLRVRLLVDADASHEEEAASSDFDAALHQIPATLDICTLIEQQLDLIVEQQVYSIPLNARFDLHGAVISEPPHTLLYLAVAGKGADLQRVRAFFSGIHTSYVSHASVIPLLLEPSGDELQERLGSPFASSMTNFNHKMSSPHQQRVADLQQEVDQVKGVMSQNVLRVMERGDRLDNLDTRAAALQQSSATFQTTARRVQRNFCLQNLKWTIILGVVVTLLILLGLFLILRTAGVFK
ncbi:V-SNARE coiled-coil-like proteiny domain-containing protein [Aphelenchoides fujianensis]|nr:V-SNARE coiled-coil-like proteiny domain-containing protein [Aphelenchoides fujianensis]